MTDYELAVLSRFGETHRYVYKDAENVKEAIAWTYWGIGGCHWRLTDYREQPSVRVRWHTEGKDGRTISYVKFYYCERLRLLGEMKGYTMEDLNNMLLGKDVVFIVSDNATGKDESYHRQIPYPPVDDRYKTVRWEWLHQTNEDREMKELLEQFGMVDA